MRTGQPEIRPSGSPGDGPSSSALNFENLKCTVLTTFDEVTCSQSEWDEASLRLGGSIYMSYDWLRVWWEFYGKGKELRLFIFRDGQRIVALLPLYLEILGVSPVKLRVARLVGANIPPKAFDPAVDEGASQAVFEHVINRLFLWDKCDLLSYGPVSGLRKCYTGLLRAADSSPEIVRSGHKISDDVIASFGCRQVLSNTSRG